MESYTEQMKVPPHDLDIERSLLSILVSPGNNGVKATARERLSKHDFYRTAHEHIFETSLEAQDIAHLAHLLEKQGMLDKVGGKAYLGEIATEGSIPAALPHLIEVLKDLSQRRNLILKAIEISEGAYNLTTDIQELTSETIKTLRDHGGERDYIGNADLAQTVFKDIERRAQEGNKDVGLLSGLEILDSYLYGFESGTLTYIIGRPSMGKTALLLNIAGYMADRYPGKVLFYSLEMSKEALFRRRLAAYSGVYLSRLRNADIGDPQWADLIKASEELSKSDLLIIDNTKYRHIEDLVTNAHALAGEHKVTALFADHIQKMRPRQKAANRHLEISYVSNEFAALSKDLGIPVIVASQLNRQVEDRKDKKPMLSDMKESGDLEQDADLVFGIYRKDTNSEIMDIACLKGRDIQTFKGQLFFNGALQKCEDIGDEWSGQGIKSEQ